MDVPEMATSCVGRDKDGWVDGVSRTQALKMLGNAVVPQQAALALELLA